jgi:hypothetical protein
VHLLAGLFPKVSAVAAPLQCCRFGGVRLFCPKVATTNHIAAKATKSISRATSLLKRQSCLVGFLSSGDW